LLAGGYPDDPGSNPAHPGGLSKKDCVVIDGFSEALCFAFRTDNSGPPENIQVSNLTTLCINNIVVNFW
jgi:hypothetical protein